MLKMMIAFTMLAISGTASAAPVFLECLTGTSGHKMAIKIDEEHGVVEWLGTRSKASFGPDIVAWDVYQVSRKTLGLQVLNSTNDGFMNAGTCKIVQTVENKF